MDNSFSEKQIRDFKNIVYNTGGNCGDFTAFFKILAAYDQFELPILADHLVRIELARIEHKFGSLQDIFEQVNEDSKFIKRYELICSKTVTCLDIHFVYPTLFLVDELPKEFAKMPWDGMCVDAMDEKHYGIAAGIYFRRKNLAHPYFDLIVSHELIHWIISLYSKEYFPVTSLYEEGLCDYLSYLILQKASLITDDAISNFILFNRFLKKPNSLWKNYYSFSKYISNIVSMKGLGFVIGLIKKGRIGINALGFETFNSGRDVAAENPISLCYSIAESTLVLDCAEFYLFDRIVENSRGYFTESDLKYEFLSQEEIKDSLKKLVNMGLVSGVGNKFYNSYPVVPSNIKFSLPEISERAKQDK